MSRTSAKTHSQIDPQLGFEPFATYLQTHYVQPLAKQLFPEESQTVDDHHCFLVRYKKGEDLGLDMHEDDSEVTLNVCLGREFENATLTFCGMADDWTGHRYVLWGDGS